MMTKTFRLNPRAARALWPIMLIAAGPASAAPPEWKAPWIADPAVAAQEAGVFHFRRDFDLSARPERFVVHVSADNRYRLFVNNVQVSEGPARGDLTHWRYETVDLAPHLRPGRNALTALVWNMGQWKPAAQISHRTAFLLQGEGAAAAVVDTGPEWKVQHNPAYKFDLVVGDDSGGYYVAGPGETVDAGLVPWNWDEPETDTSSWAAAKPLAMAHPPASILTGSSATSNSYRARSRRWSARSSASRACGAVRESRQATPSCAGPARW